MEVSVPHGSAQQSASSDGVEHFSNYSLEAPPSPQELSEGPAAEVSFYDI